MDSDCFQELSLCSPSFIAAFLSVEMELRLASGMTQDSLHRFTFDPRLLDKPIVERVTEVVEVKSL